MRLEAHIPISLAVSSAVYVVTKSPHTAVACFLSGILIDLDHFFDYFKSEGLKFDIRDFFHKCNNSLVKQYYLLLHSYELVLLLMLLALWLKSEVMTGIFIGITSHIFSDIFYKPEYFMYYSFIYRASINFGKGRIIFKPK
ncbi:MAG: hypothetical protein AB1633_03080 [Elusimicrobiota bacterium]